MSPSSALVRLFWPAVGGILFVLLSWIFVADVWRLLQSTQGPPDFWELVRLTGGGIWLAVVAVIIVMALRKPTAAPPAWVYPAAILTCVAALALPALEREGPLGAVRAAAPYAILIGIVWLLRPILRPFIGWLAGVEQMRGRAVPRD